MTIWVVAIVLLALFPAGLFLGLVVKPRVDRRMLRREVESNLSPGETVLFESLARRSPNWWQHFVLINGLMSVTNRRLIWVAWLIPILVKRFREVKPEQIDSVNLRGAAVEVVQGGHVVTFYPQEIMPFPDERLARAAFEALTQLKAGVP